MLNPAFHCVVCGKRIQAAADPACGIVECPHCLRMVPVPSPAALPGEIACAHPAFPPEILAVEIKFRCEACEAKLGIDVRLLGGKVTCPVCAARVSPPRLVKSADAAAVRPAAASLLSLAETEFLSGKGEPLQKTGAAH